MNSSKLTPGAFLDLGRATASAFGEDKIYRHAAALAYFTVFSLSPMLLVVISIAALYFGGASQASGAITAQLQDTVGPVAGKAIEQMIQTANDHGSDAARPITATIIAFAVALWGASGLFGALQDSLNTIWNVMPDPKIGFMGVIKTRFLSFAMVLGVGFLLLVSLVATTVLASLSKMLSGAVGDSIYVAWTLNFSLGLGVSLLLFAAIFKVLPDAKIQWHDVWIGAFVTALLFSLGRLALGVYLGRPGTASAFGSAGALVVLLLWVNYASTILFVGAEFTKAYANRFGSKIVPSEGAIVADGPEAQAAKNAPSGAQSHDQNRVAPEKRGATSGALPGAPASHQAERDKHKKQEFEHTLAVVAGAFLTVMWVWRRRAREEE